MYFDCVCFNCVWSNESVCVCLLDCTDVKKRKDELLVKVTVQESVKPVICT